MPQRSLNVSEQQDQRETIGVAGNNHTTVIIIRYTFKDFEKFILMRLCVYVNFKTDLIS